MNQLISSIFYLIKTIFLTGFGFVPIATWFTSRPAVYFDGFLWMAIGAGTAFASEIGSESIYKYWNPYTLTSAKIVNAVLLGGAVALKTFRSTSYSKHVDDAEKKDAISTVETSRVTNAGGETKVETAKTTVTKEPNEK